MGDSTDFLPQPTPAAIARRQNESSARASLSERQGLAQLMQNEGYDLSKFELVAVPEAFSDAPGLDQLGHGGLLEYDGVLDIEDMSDNDSEPDPYEGFNVTIEHVADDLGGSGMVHLLDVPDHNHHSNQPFHERDVLDIGIEASDMKSLLEQFEECEQPKNKIETPQPQIEKKDPQIKAAEERQQVMTPKSRNASVPLPKELPNPADIVKKIAPVKRKGAILLEANALPIKKMKAKPAVPAPHAEVARAIHAAQNSDSSSPVPFDLKHLIPIPKYLSMEHDYCLSPAQSEKSNASDLSPHMSKEQRRAYYRNRYKVKKKGDGINSPAKGSSVSSSPVSMSPAGGSPNPSLEGGAEGKVPQPQPNVPTPEPVVPLFDKIPGYFSKKLLLGMYKEIDSSNPNQPVHLQFDKNIFVANNNNEQEKAPAEISGQHPEGERLSRPQHRGRHHRSYRKSRRKNSVSSQSDSSYCSSCSGDHPADGDARIPSHNQQRPTHRRRSSVRSAGELSQSLSRSRSRSRSASYSSYNSHDSRSHDRSRHSNHRSRSYSRSRSRSNSNARSRSYSRSLSRSRSRSRAYSGSRSRSRSHSREFHGRSRSFSRSLSRSPRRSHRSVSRRSNRSGRSRSRRKSSSRRPSIKSKSSGYQSSFRMYDPNAGNSEVKYTEEQLEEFDERRVLYVGNIDKEVTRTDLNRQFSRFGPVDKIQLFFREEQDSYGFVTFRYHCDAIAAIQAESDPNWPQYELCFGGRRKFCTTKYEDLDSLNKASTDLDYGYHGNDDGGGDEPPHPEESEFDKLLKAAMKGTKRRR